MGPMECDVCPLPPVKPECFLCGAGEGDQHWSGCAFAPEGLTADDDPDADESERACELS